MSFLENWEGVLGAAASGEAGGYVIPQFVAAGVSEGVSGAAMLGAIREAGLGMRTQAFYGLFREVQETVARAENLGGVNMLAPGGGIEVLTFEGGEAGTYRQRVYTLFREVDDLGNHNVYRGSIDIKSEQLLTPEEAFGRAETVWATNGDRYRGQSLIGFEYGGAWEQLGR